MDESKLAAYRATAATVIKNLNRRNMEGYYRDTAEEAVELVCGMIPAGDSVTWGGSMTFTESGMRAALEAGPWKLLDRATAHTPEERREMWRDRTSADWFFMSTNALTVGGELVNIDGNGDRLACLVHGPAHVVVLVGMNKLVADVDAGIKRIRTVTCPMNAARLHTETPCETHGICGRCHAERCMCCETVVTRHSPRRPHQGRPHRPGPRLLIETPCAPAPRGLLAAGAGAPDTGSTGAAAPRDGSRPRSTARAARAPVKGSS